MGNISSVLKAKRKELGLTLAQIAEKIGVTEATVQRWESGNIKSLRHERIAKLADILGVTPSVLMGWDEPTAPTLPSPTITEDTVTFPVITSVAAHYDGVSIDESAAGEKIEVPRAYLKGRKAEDFCAMRVRGSRTGRVCVHRSPSQAVQEQVSGHSCGIAPFLNIPVSAPAGCR